MAVAALEQSGKNLAVVAVPVAAVVVAGMARTRSPVVMAGTVRSRSPVLAVVTVMVPRSNRGGDCTAHRNTDRRVDPDRSRGSRSHNSPDPTGRYSRHSNSRSTTVPIRAPEST